MASGDRLLAYGSSADLTITLASLGTSSGRTAGRESTAISNTSNKYLDVLLAGKITTSASPTASKRIEVWVYASRNDTPTYPDSLTGSDAAKTFTSADILGASCRLAATLLTDNTSNRTYEFGPVSVADLFGGRLPKNWGAFVVHDTGVSLHATGSNHAITYTPVYENIAP